MSKYVIITDSSCDLNKEYRKKHNIDYAKMMINWTDEEGDHESYADIDWEVLSSEQFYDIIRRGYRIRTAQVTMQNYIDAFEPHLKKGEDILYLACSSGLSASIKTAEMLVNNELKAKYPERKIVLVDTLRAGMAQGLIVMKAQELKDEGKSIEEVRDEIEKIKTQYKEVGIPDVLIYLKRAGRVSGPAQFMGDMIGLKPILMFDEKGFNEAKEKAIGKKKAFARMAEMIKNDIIDPENQEIYLMNADCQQKDIDNFKAAILAQIKVKDIIVEPLGPIIGASSGPGTIIINYRGK